MNEIRRNLMRQESGQALVEFAICLSVLILFLAGIADFSIYIFERMELQEAAAAGAAYATIPGNQKDTSGISFAAAQAAPDISGMNVQVQNIYACTPGGAAVTSTTTCTGSTTPLLYVQVTTTATVPGTLRWTLISSSLSLQGYSIYRVPWTS